MEIRIGLPLTGGALVREAKAHRLPVLFSANAFVRRNPERDRVSFRLPKTGTYRGLDAALDSAGFVAMAKYNGYEWTVEQYMKLAAAQDWTWYAQMDCCCEPEVAGDAAERRLRLAETARLYGACASIARREGMALPMPVLQGWSVDDYRRSAGMLPVSQWPALVGLGSVCRRSVGGEDGIAAIVDALDRILPAGVQLHLFGVKGAALELLHGHERIRSMDSMAWDMAARRKWPTGRTMARRISELHRWREAQLERCTGSASGLQGSLALSREDEMRLDEAEELAEWEELIAGGEIEMQSAACHWAREAPYREESCRQDKAA